MTKITETNPKGAGRKTLYGDLPVERIKILLPTSEKKRIKALVSDALKDFRTK